MKKLFYFYIALQLITSLSRAENGHQSYTNSNSKKAKEGTAQLSFHKHDFGQCNKDSVLVICDRFDRSGAGVVFKVFYPSDNQNISVTGIPEGKYFITIQCLGRHHDKFEKIIKIKSGKCENIAIKLSDCDEYSKEKVVIPGDHFDFSKLSIISMK